MTAAKYSMEIQQYMKKHNVNPLKGMLPMIVQVITLLHLLSMLLHVIT